jgi:hypothetical protein
MAGSASGNDGFNSCSGVDLRVIYARVCGHGRAAAKRSQSWADIRSYRSSLPDRPGAVGRLQVGHR